MAVRTGKCPALGYMNLPHHHDLWLQGFWSNHRIQFHFQHWDLQRCLMQVSLGISTVFHHHQQNNQDPLLV
jgi:hypothetical protein